MLARVLASVAAVALLVGAQSAHGAAFDIAGSSAGGIDAGGPVNSAFVTGASGAITDLNIQFLVSRPSGSIHAEDWSVTLIHGATEVTLNLPGGGHVVVSSAWNATWDDEAASPLTDVTSFADGTYIPFAALSAFDGLDLSGLWTLRFNDSELPGEGDQLDSWRIFGTTANGTAVPMPATLALLALGVGGLALARRRT